MKKVLLLALVLFAFSACSQLENVKKETTEAVTNLQNEASDIKENVDKKVDQVNGAVESVNNAVESVNNAVEDVNNAVENVKSITK